jgi:hypothetical protein
MSKITGLTLTAVKRSARIQQLRDLVAQVKDNPADVKAREESFVFGTLRCEDPSLSRETVLAALREQR